MGQILHGSATTTEAVRSEATSIRPMRRPDRGIHQLNHEMPSHAKDETLRLDCARFRERGARAVDG
jgi:hypothetical protein